MIINAHNFGGGSYDTDAAAYIAAVETADGTLLGTKYKDAINDFVVGAKADGFWSAIKAACFLAGPATLAGALVPLVGTAPTNVNFVSGDHNQVNGLTGDGSTKYLDANRANNADPQNSKHLSVWVQTVTNQRAYIGTSSNSLIRLSGVGSSTLNCRANGSADINYTSGNVAGFIGVSRANSSQHTQRAASTDQVQSATSASPPANALFVFRINGTGAYGDGTLGWYSIGESLDLSQLDSRLATYMAAIA